mmetsp:Transcript_29406/g.62583  ORF Transcript_29406/g.62583 Transcript_29406/m.62583 type:complete len:490 (+) Transcript_29406:135-1604(+)
MEGTTRGQQQMSSAPAAVASRLCDLLLQFPAAAMGGVQWRVLARKYEERHGAPLGLSGHSSALPAATALLWDVLRLVDGEDAENPVVAVEDGVALAPRPGAMGSWPSLYRALCVCVRQGGTEEAVPTLEEADVAGSGVASAGHPARSLLLSQLKPLLQCHWHAAFDESGSGFLDEYGTFVRVRKMKHLVQAVLRWREQRMAWRRAHGGRPSGVDKVLEERLELVASKTHNDLVLRCVEVGQASPEETCEAAEKVVSPAPLPIVPVASPLDDELVRLRAENSELRSRNEELLRGQAQALKPEAESPSALPQPRLEFCVTPVKQAPAPKRMPELFDDPYEPPPQREGLWSAPTSPTASIRSTSTSWPPSSVDFGFGAVGMYSMSGTPRSGCATGASATPLSSCLDAASGAATPTAAGAPDQAALSASAAAAALGNQVCALVPMWFSLVPSCATFLGDRCVIPTGIVEKVRTRFEPGVGEASSTSRPLFPGA